MDLSKSIKKPFYILLPVFAAFFLGHCSQDSSNLIAEYTLTVPTPVQMPDNVGPLRLTFAPLARHSTIETIVDSQGNAAAISVHLSLVCTGKPLLNSPSIRTSPDDLPFRYQTTDNFKIARYWFPSLPGGSRVVLDVDISTDVKTSDFMIELNDARRVYKVRPKHINPVVDASFWKNIVRKLFLADNRVWAAEISKTIRFEDKKSGASIDIDGYDPILLIQITLQRYVNMGLITQGQYNEMDTEARSHNIGPQLGGDYLLRLNEGALTLLIQQKILTKQEAHLILKRSAAAGGTVINGYNVNVLAAELLNKLIEKKLVSTTDAQATIDAARYDRHWRK